MSGRAYLALLVAAALALPAIPEAVARAQPPAPTIVAVSLADTVDVMISSAIETARRQGIPIAPLEAKVREGRLKRASASRIRSAVVALASRLDSARAALGPAATTEELVAGADALAAGADVTAVRAVHAASLGRPVSAPLGALAQLVASGVPSSRALTLIVDLIRRNATPAQVIAFGNSVETDAAGGLPAEESARFRWREFGNATGHATTLAAEDAPPLPGSMTAGSPSSSPRAATPRRRP
jgi:hypothetical protein